MSPQHPFALLTFPKPYPSLMALRTTRKPTLKIRRLIAIRISRKLTRRTTLTDLRIKPQRNSRHTPRLPTQHHLRGLGLIRRRDRPETHRPSPRRELRRGSDLRRAHSADGSIGGVAHPGFVSRWVAVAGLDDVDCALAGVVEGGACGGDGGAGFGPAVGGVNDSTVGEDAV